MDVVIHNHGPRCRVCNANEARCAWLGPCCRRCSHFSTLDADGNDKPHGNTKQAAA